MVFEGGKFKITSGDARGLSLTMLGDGEDANILSANPDANDTGIHREYSGPQQ